MSNTVNVTIKPSYINNLGTGIRAQLTATINYLKMNDKVMARDSLDKLDELLHRLKKEAR